MYITHIWVSFQKNHATYFTQSNFFQLKVYFGYFSFSGRMDLHFFITVV